MIVRQTSLFKRQVKKMRRAEKEVLDKVVKIIMADPSIGDMKIGDLAGIQVHKYKHNTQQYLIAYEYINDELVLTFIDHGTHENFYQGLKH